MKDRNERSNTEVRMNNAEGNPTQGQQNVISGQSPSKEPAHETGRADPKKMERDFEKSPASSADAASDARAASQARDPNPLPEVEPAHAAEPHPDPVHAARSRIVSADTAGTQASDSTVDTDGKGSEARRGHGPLRDNTIHSNAAPQDHVPTPPIGLGGIDSRAEGNLVSIALQPGWHVVDLGSTTYTGFNGGRGARHFRLEQHGTTDAKTEASALDDSTMPQKH
jgi:Protein of unknown function (DUF3005)